MTRADLVAALLVERYGPTRPEDVAGYAVDDSGETTKRRRDALKEAVIEHEGGRNWRAA